MHCHKRIYRDKRAVVMATKRVMRRRKNRPKHIRSYFCHLCLGWHLTHQEQQERFED